MISKIKWLWPGLPLTDVGIISFYRVQPGGSLIPDQNLNHYFRPEWPDYVKEFAQPFNDKEKKFGSNYRRIWN